MKKNLSILAISSILISTMSLTAFAAVDATVTSIPVNVTSSIEKENTSPSSYLYYGQVEEISTDEDGTITSILLNSEKDGQYVINVSTETLWIDSGNKTASDSTTLEVGESIYAFHSLVETASLPPQSPGLAIIRNIPQDARAAQYHIVNSIEETDGLIQITTTSTNTSDILTISADKDTNVVPYLTKNLPTLNDITEGSSIMVWYDELVVEASNGYSDTYATNIMILPQEQTEEDSTTEDNTDVNLEDTISPDTGLFEFDHTTLTRGDLISALYKYSESPEITVDTNFSDVVEGSEYYNATVWATSNGIISGYGNNTFGLKDDITREQLITILWRFCDSPKLMDYPGLTKYEDISEASIYAQPALAWADQLKLINTSEGNILNPKDTVTVQELNDMMNILITN